MRIDEKASFGLWLKERRKALHLTQEDITERMACSVAMVRKIEAGERVASQQMADLLAFVSPLHLSEPSGYSSPAEGNIASRRSTSTGQS